MMAITSTEGGREGGKRFLRGTLSKCRAGGPAMKEKGSRSLARSLFVAAVVAA